MIKTKYGIGLDIGIGSVGYAAIALDDNENPEHIIDLGVRLFSVPEDGKGHTKQSIKTQHRSARRLSRRKRVRKASLKSICVRHGLVGSVQEIKSLTEGVQPDLYELRVKGLDELLSRQDFCRVILRVAKKRGFKSNRKHIINKDDGKVLVAVKENTALMLEKGYRTVGEMLYKDPKFEVSKKNHSDEYLTNVTRYDIENELHMLFAAQRRLGADFADEAFENDFIDRLLCQRKTEDGPGEGSPYGGNQIEKMVGHCSLEPEEKRAAKACHCFEIFSLWQDLNNLSIIGPAGRRRINLEDKKAIVELCYKQTTVNYKKLRSLLNLNLEDRFSLLKYDFKTKKSKGDGGEQEEAAESYEEVLERVEKKNFNRLTAYHKIRTACNSCKDGLFETLTYDDIDTIATILTCYKSDETLSKALSDAGFGADIIEATSGLEFSNFCNLSKKALLKITPFMEQGMDYYHACDAAGYSGNNNDKSFHLPSIDKAEELSGINYTNMITSANTLTAIKECIKTINSVISKMGRSPLYINVELARDLPKTKKERDTILKQNNSRHKANETIKTTLESEFHLYRPKGIDIVKYKLFKAQNGISPYSQKPITPEDFTYPGRLEVDHIIPYSISCDDSYNNKVLVFASENREKGNRIPLDYLRGEQREGFIKWVKDNKDKMSYVKRDNFLRTAITEDDYSEFTARSLQDTRHASKFVMNYIENYLQFDESLTGKKRHVFAVNGATTAYMRNRWGLSKNRSDGDLHHALDAAVIACTTPSLVRKVGKYSKYHECKFMDKQLSYTEADDELGSMLIDESTGEIIDQFPMPWVGFRKELLARLDPDPSKRIAELRIPYYMQQDAPEVKPVIAYRRVKQKMTGAAHKETIKSAKLYSQGAITYCRKPLTSLSLIKDPKTGKLEIKDYLQPEKDMLLYNALKERLIACDGDAKKAFKEPFYYPTRPTELVRAVKICQVENNVLYLPKCKGMASQDTQTKVDVYRNESGGYSLVPHYVADNVKAEKPMKICGCQGPYESWAEADPKDYLFTLKPYTPIHIYSEKPFTMHKRKDYKDSDLPDSYETNEAMLYYTSTNISSGAINAITHDNTYELVNKGVKTLNKPREVFEIVSFS